MISKRLWWVAAAVVLVGLGVGAATPAWALDIPLPGERKIQVHGFYELRVRGFFRNNPFGNNGTTLSQFRHVLDLETDIDIAPEGVGPFDYLGGYTRWLISYECVYERACGAFKSANSFGGNNRNASRIPANFKTARTRKSDIAGLVPAPFLPGTLIRNGGHNPNPGRRLTSCFIPDGMFATAYPLGAFCNLNQRSKLDGPIFPSTLQNPLGGSFGADQRAAQRAGSTNFSLSAAQFSASRSFLRQAGLGSLSSILARPTLNIRSAATASSFLADASRLQQNAAFFSTQAQRLRRSGGASSAVEALENAAAQKVNAANASRAKADAILMTSAGSFATRESLLPKLPDARPDPDRFGQLSRLQAPDLVSAVWGVTHFSDTNVPWLANLNAAIRPGGYFTKPTADTVSQFAFGILNPIIEPSFTLAHDPRAGCAGDSTARCSNISVTIPNLSDQFAVEVQSQVAVFYGPDGVTGTADDLPSVGRAGGGHVTLSKDGQFGVVQLQEGTLFDRGLRLATSTVTIGADVGTPIAPTLSDPNRNLVVAADQNIDIYRILVKDIGSPTDPAVITSCRRLLDSNPQTVGLGGGVNADGDCIALATADAARRRQFNANAPGSDAASGFQNSKKQALGQFAAVAALGDPTFRPASAVLEPTDLTDLAGRSVSLGQGIPARPASPRGGLFFRSFGYDKLIRNHSDVIGDLDLNFTEDNLRWDHGASQDEHEFREGYLEGEFWDSQIFFRVGKLLMVWGKTELFRNQDRLNPLDIGIGTLARLDESRIGQWAADVTFSPEAWMNVGPAKDLRFEMVMLFDNFQPTDLGKCGESLTFSLVCGLAFGAEAHGLTGIGVAGLVNPYHNYSGLKRFDYAMRLEGRFDRFTFALTDFWGFDDGFLIDTVQQYSRSIDTVTGAPVASTGGACSIRRNAAGQALGPDGRRSSGTAAAGFVDPFDLDNNIPSAGNCLLWKGGNVPDGVAQARRTPDQVALLQSANQTLFHTICTLTFEEDSGSCAVDVTNGLILANVIPLVLSGQGGAGVAAPGFDTIRRSGKVIKKNVAKGILQDKITTEGPVAQDTELFARIEDSFTLNAHTVPIPDIRLLLVDPNDPNQPFDPTSPRIKDFLEFAKRQFNEVPDPNESDPRKRFEDFVTLLQPEIENSASALARRSPPAFGELSSQQKALLGCGPAFLSKCGLSDEVPLQFSPLLSRQLNLSKGLNFIFGGIDFLNADASVLTQEFTPLKAFSPGASVGSRGGVRLGGSNPEGNLQFEAGIATNRAIDSAIQSAKASKIQADLGPDRIAGTADDLDRPLTDFLDFVHLTQTPLGGGSSLHSVSVRSGVSVTNGGPKVDLAFATDFQIEPQRWKLDPALAEQGIIVYQVDPNNPEGGSSQFNQTDPNDPSTRFGENCTPFAGGPDPGCTALEMISANLERLSITNEILGPDHSFDPAETLHEFFLMLDGDPSTDFRGDPISGPDGITFANYVLAGSAPPDRGYYGYLSSDPNGAPVEIDLHKYQKRVFVREGSVQTVEKLADCSTSGACYLRLPLDDPNSTLVDVSGDQVAQVGALPLAVALPPVGSNRKILVALQFMTPGELQKLVNATNKPGQLSVTLEVPRIVNGSVAFKNGKVQTDTREISVKSKFGGAFFDFLSAKSQSAFNIDLGNESGFKFGDLDENRDGKLDFLDDGTAGPVSDDNPLCGSGLPGDVLQDGLQVELAPAEQTTFDTLKIPPRSPVFCRSVSGLLGVTGQTLPSVRAGGNGQFGRRDFIWQGGQEVVLNFQKRNVVGASVDFANGATKTSWGIEATWTPNKLFPDTRARDGLHESDEYDLTVSVDRPTFFNFLNPNRSFFINFQFFLRYFSNFIGGRANKDGMFGTAGGSLDGIVTLTMFTGYFQDRLQPRMTALFSPLDGSAAVLSSMSYRYNDRFSTSIALNHFFLTRGATQGLDRTFPIALRTRNDPTSEVFRGVSAVRNRDVGVLTIRYTF